VENWNRCLDLAHAPYVCVFHQDDVMLPENLAEKVAILDRHPNVGMVHSNVYQIAADGEVLSAYWYFAPSPGDEGVHGGDEYFATLFRGVNRVCCPSVVMRRSCYQQLGGFDPRLPFTTDWEMWMRIALHADVAYLATPLVKYRRHDDNETAKYLGAKGLEHALLAKQLVLEKFPGRIANVDALRSELVAGHRDLAIAEAARLYAQGLSGEAREHVALALGIGAMVRADGAGDGEEREWLTDVIDRAFNVGARPVGGVSPETLRQSPTYASTLEAAFPRDLASHVSLRRLVKTLVMKLSRQPGFRWLGGLRTVGNRLFRG
jgi:hypothetical protein